MSFLTQYKLSIDILFWLGLYPISINSNSATSTHFNTGYHLTIFLLSTICMYVVLYMVYIVNPLNTFKDIQFLFGAIQSWLIYIGSSATIFNCFLTNREHIKFLNDVTLVDCKIMKLLSCKRIDDPTFYKKCMAKDFLLIFSYILLTLTYFTFSPNLLFENWHTIIFTIVMQYYAISLAILVLHIQNCANILTRRYFIIRMHLQQINHQHNDHLYTVLNITKELWQIKEQYAKSVSAVIFFNLCTDFIWITVSFYYQFLIALYELNELTSFRKWMQYFGGNATFLLPFIIKIVLLFSSLNNLAMEVC